MIYLRNYIIILFLFIGNTAMNAQFGAGLTMGIDFYQLYDQGENAINTKSSTTGSAITNIILGPKIWIGEDKFSFSLEAPVNWGMFALDINDYKGLGSVAFPLGAKFNFGAASGFNQSNVLGWSIGGGIQYTNTEIYYLEERFEDRIETGFIPTYYGELGVAFGVAGVDFTLYTRYGLNEKDASSLNIGLVTNINLIYLNRFEKEQRSTSPPKPSYSYIGE